MSNVLPVEMPPLREHLEDIPLLVRHFMERAAKPNRKAMREVDEEAQALLMGYGWPGNVRELQNMMERVVILGSDGPVTAGELQDCVRRKKLVPKSQRQLLWDFHQRALGHAIDLANGNARLAAEITGMHYKSFHRAAKRARLSHKIRPPSPS